MQITDNFNISEFMSKDGAKMPDNVLVNIKELAKNLQVIRNIVCAPISINSAYRSILHNKAVGGAKNSYHVKGMAADITIEGLTPKEVHSLLLDLIKEGKISEGGLGLYNSFTHYDIRKTKARW